MKKSRYLEIIFAWLLVLVGLYICRDLFSGTKILTGDTWGLANWTDYLRASLSRGYFPQWNHSWAGGIPFFGIVPPFTYAIFYAFSFISSSSIVVVQAASIFFFILAGITAYFFLYNRLKNVLAAFFGAFVYLVLPVHSGSILTMGMTDMLIVYALVPLVLLLTCLTLEKRSPWLFFLLAVTFAVFSLVQIEATFIYTIFLFLPFTLVLAASDLKGRKELIINIRNSMHVLLLSIVALSVPAGFFATTLLQKRYFSFHAQDYIEAGLKLYSFASFAELFAKAKNYSQLFSLPATEYYVGYLLLAILLAAVVSLVVQFKKDSHAKWFALFFLVAGAMYLWACFQDLPGNYFFYHLPILKEIRVPFRFYYPLAVSISFLAGYFIRAFSDNPKRYGISLLVVLALAAFLLADFKDYFSFHSQTMVDRGVSEQLCSQIQQHIPAQQGLTPTRIMVFPNLAFPSICAKDVDGARFEMVNNWLDWDQTIQQSETIAKFSPVLTDRSFEQKDVEGLENLATNYVILYNLNIDHLFSQDYKNGFTDIITSISKLKDIQLVTDTQTNEARVVIFKLVKPEKLVGVVSGVPVSVERFSVTPVGLETAVVVNEDQRLTIRYFNNPWWKATINGRSVDLNQRATFIEIPVRAGQNQIELKYDFPALRNVFYAIAFGSLVGLALIFLTILAKKVPR